MSEEKFDASPCRITAVEMAQERGVDPKRFRGALRNSGKFPSRKKNDRWVVSYGSTDHHNMIDVLKMLIC